MSNILSFVHILKKKIVGYLKMYIYDLLPVKGFITFFFLKKTYSLKIN